MMRANQFLKIIYDSGAAPQQEGRSGTRPYRAKQTRAAQSQSAKR